MGTTPFLEAREVSRYYGRTSALKSVSLFLEKGRNTLVLGPNGAGKSTLCRTLALLARPSSGIILWEGEPVCAKKRGECRTRLGYLSHQLFLYNHLSAEENLDFFAALYGIPAREKKIAGLMDQFGLASHRRKLAGNLSRGMQQRLSLARLLLADPELLILDEPFAGLDEESSGALRSFLVSLRQSDKAVLLVTHEIPEARGIADDLLVLDRGEVRFFGEAPPPGKIRELYLEKTGASPP